MTRTAQNTQVFLPKPKMQILSKTKVEAFTATTRTKNLDAAAILNVKVNNLTSVANNIANMSSRPKEDNGHIPSPLLQNYF